MFTPIFIQTQPVSNKQSSRILLQPGNYLVHSDHKTSEITLKVGTQEYPAIKNNFRFVVHQKCNGSILINAAGLEPEISISLQRV